jgi:hypothetical protein
MKRRLSFVFTSVALAGTLSLTSAVDAYGFGWWAPPQRGVAILPPAESPDRCASPVGGKSKVVPYYTTYWARSRRDPHMRRCVHGCGSTWSAGDGQSIEFEHSADYGLYSGASRDEAKLTHLGGAGLGADGLDRSEEDATTDIIDEIQSRHGSCDARAHWHGRITRQRHD